VNTPREAAFGRKGAKTPKRKVPTPGAAERTPAKTAPVAGKAGISSRKMMGKGVGVETPTPVWSGPTTRARPSTTTPSSAVRPAERKAPTRKKAAKPLGVEAGIPPANQLPAQRKRLKKSSIRRRLPRTAVGMRRMRGVPSVTTTFGIKEISRGGGGDGVNHSPYEHCCFRGGARRDPGDAPYRGRRQGGAGPPSLDGVTRLTRGKRSRRVAWGGGGG